jgi:hypothetical protein
MKYKLNKKDKFLIALYIIAIIIPFGVLITLFIYAILYYAFDVPLKKEKELLTFALKKTEAYIKKLFKC